jgi:hypothetical protein
VSKRSEWDETEAVTAVTSPAGWHPVDPVSLVAGLIAVGIAVLSQLDVDVDGAIVVAAVLVAAGLAGLVAALRRDDA